MQDQHRTKLNSSSFTENSIRPEITRGDRQTDRITLPIIRYFYTLYVKKRNINKHVKGKNYVSLEHPRLKSVERDKRLCEVI